MGLLGEENDESVEEVSISAAADDREDNSELMNEVESKFSSRKNASKSSGRNSDSVSLEDLHRQNEKIISLLEDLVEDKSSSKNKNDDLVGGDMNGVL